MRTRNNAIAIKLHLQCGNGLLQQTLVRRRAAVALLADWLWLAGLVCAWQSAARLVAAALPVVCLLWPQQRGRLGTSYTILLLEVSTPGIMVLLFLLVMSLTLSSMKSISRQKFTRLHSTVIQPYQFIDSGNFKRIEQFGSCNVVRSCPSASWPPASSWTRYGNMVTYDGTSGKAGIWNRLEQLPNNWQVMFDLDRATTARIVFTLAASDLGQVGVFPEQQENWKWIYNTLQQQQQQHPSSSMRKVLNGFAYTGGSTMAALSADNVQVVHLDAAKSSVQWAMRNAAASGLYSPTATNISNSDSSSSTSRSVRWITDDCLTFLEREVRRGNTYEGLIFDPPAFGRGGNGKIWKLDKDLPVLVETLIPQLMSDNPLFVLLSCHDIEWPASRLAALIQTAVTKKASSAGARWLGGRNRLRDNKEHQRVGTVQNHHDDDEEVQSIALCGGVLEYGPMILSESNDAPLTTTSSTTTPPSRQVSTDRLAERKSQSQSQSQSQSNRPLPLGGFARWRQLI